MDQPGGSVINDGFGYTLNLARTLVLTLTLAVTATRILLLPLTLIG